MTPQEAQRLGALLRDARHRMGLSAREVARRAGVDIGTVTRIEDGQILSPRADSLTAIGAVVGVPAADLFAMTDWLPKGELPTFKPYLRAKYGDLPEAAREEVETFFARLRSKHGLSGPQAGEDEK